MEDIIVAEPNETSTLPAMEAAQPQATGAETTPKGGAEDKGGTPEAATTPAPRTYSEDEWNKRQSAVDKQLAKLNSELKTLRDTQAQAEEQARNSQIEQWFRSLEDRGDDPADAKKVVEAIQADWRRAKEILARERQLSEQAALLSEAGKGKQAQDLAKQYGLDESAVPQLLEAGDSNGMELVATKLALAKAKQAATPPANVDSGGNRGEKRDLSKMAPSMALGTMMEESFKK